MHYRSTVILSGIAVAAVGVLLAAAPALAQADGWTVPRLADGHPDLSGTYNTATLTPLVRPAEFGDNLYLSEEEANEIAEAERLRNEERSLASDPNREAPPAGGDGSPGAAGNVGGYNTFWIDRGSDAILIDGKFRTSILYEPKNGRMPEMTEAARKAREARFGRGGFRRRGNDGTAWWLENDGPGPYDNMEQRGLGERCLLGFGTTAGPPAMPVLYNNFKRIVQTPTHVVILVEMVHDARIVPIDSQHGPDEIRSWMGDSIGYWDGDTLVVETRNFNDQSRPRGASENVKVTERFTRIAEDRILYNFTVDDPDTWVEPWSGEYPWVLAADDEHLYEYACHEGNYALGNIMRGARLLEADVLGGNPTGSGN